MLHYVNQLVYFPTLSAVWCWAVVYSGFIGAFLLKIKEVRTVRGYKKQNNELKASVELQRTLELVVVLYQDEGTPFTSCLLI